MSTAEWHRHCRKAVAGSQTGKIHRLQELPPWHNPPPQGRGNPVPLASQGRAFGMPDPIRVAGHRAVALLNQPTSWQRRGTHTPRNADAYTRDPWAWLQEPRPQCPVCPRLCGELDSGRPDCDWGCPGWVVRQTQARAEQHTCTIRDGDNAILARWQQQVLADRRAEAFARQR